MNEKCLAPIHNIRDRVMYCNERKGESAEDFLDEMVLTQRAIEVVGMGYSKITD
jgi:hypothetical protein